MPDERAYDGEARALSLFIDFRRRGEFWCTIVQSSARDSRNSYLQPPPESGLLLNLVKRHSQSPVRGANYSFRIFLKLPMSLSIRTSPFQWTAEFTVHSHGSWPLIEAILVNGTGKTLSKAKVLSSRMPARRDAHERRCILSPFTPHYHITSSRELHLSPTPISRHAALSIATACTAGVPDNTFPVKGFLEAMPEGGHHLMSEMVYLMVALVPMVQAGR